MKNVGQCGAPVQFLHIFLNLETTVCKKPYFYNNKSIQNSSINLLETFMIKCLLDTTPSEKGPLINIKIVFSKLFWQKLLFPVQNTVILFSLIWFIKQTHKTLVWSCLEKYIWVSRIGRCATLAYTSVHYFIDICCMCNLISDYVFGQN